MGPALLPLHGNGLHKGKDPELSDGMYAGRGGQESNGLWANAILISKAP